MEVASCPVQYTGQEAWGKLHRSWTCSTKVATKLKDLCIIHIIDNGKEARDGTPEFLWGTKDSQPIYMSCEHKTIYVLLWRDGQPRRPSFSSPAFTREQIGMDQHGQVLANLPNVGTCPYDR